MYSAFGGLLALLLLSSDGFSKTPYTDAEIRAIETSDEGKIRSLRDQEITQLRIALGRRQPSNRRADLYFRLAEIYMEAYRMEFLLEGRAHEKRLEKNISDPFIDHTRSRPFLSKGIQASKEILRFKIPYSKMDHVYYFLGFNHGELGETQESIKYFEYLTFHYPESPFISEAFRELGEAAYANTQFKKAQGYYESAAKKTPPEILPRIQHKLAWAFYRTRQYDRAVSTLKLAITGATRSGEKFLSLREEALRDMAVFMTESGRVEEAIEYFQNVAGDKTFYPRALEKLGRQYERSVEPAKATLVYESLLKTHPDSEAAFRVLVKLVDLDLRRGHYKDALGRLRDPEFPKAREDETAVAFQNLRAMIRRTATEHHEKFRKNADRPALEVAEAYYEAYLRLFLSREDPRQETPEIQMYLAEVKRDLNKSTEASALYRSVLESRDKRYAKEAGALWTASLADAIRKSEKSAKGSADPSSLEREFIDAADKLQETLGENPEGREAVLKAAEVLAGYPSTQKEAIKRIKSLIKRGPRTSQALTAARLWIQILSEKDERSSDLSDVLDELKENSALMSADQEIGKGKLRITITDQETRLKIGEIARDEKEKDYSSAAKGYEAFAKEAVTRELAEKSFSSAIHSYARILDDQSIERVSTAWLKRYPKSPKAIEAIRFAATHDLIQGKFEASAKFFEKLGLDGGDPGSLETAALIYEGNGDLSHAQQTWGVYLQSYKTEKNRPGIALMQARSYEASAQDALAIKTYQDCLSEISEVEAECGTRLADLYLRMKKAAEAKALLNKVSQLGNQKKKPGQTFSPYVGYARYRLAELLEREATLEPMRQPEAQLKKAMNQRLDFLEGLNRAFGAAVEVGGPWGIAALDRLALWVKNFAEDIDAIPPASGASPEGVQLFRKNLATVSGPLRKKAIDTWKDAYSKAVASELLSPSIPDIADRLADARLPSPSRAQGFRGRFRLGGIAADGGSEGSSSALEKVREKLTRNPQDAAAWIDYGNLLWGAKRPLLGKIAYQRALILSPKSPGALNNRAVIALTEESEEDWLTASEAQALFLQALKQDETFLPAKINRALLLNYFRIFPRALPLWQDLASKISSSDMQDGMGISLQGTGSFAQAEAAFKKAGELGASQSRFTSIYHESAREFHPGAQGAEKCLSRIDDLDQSSIKGFEKTAVEHLKRACTLWKNEK